MMSVCFEPTDEEFGAVGLNHRHAGIHVLLAYLAGVLALEGGICDNRKS